MKTLKDDRIQYRINSNQKLLAERKARKLGMGINEYARYLIIREIEGDVFE